MTKNGGEMDRLLALPIPGESFLLQRGGKNILVDGGTGSIALFAALTAPSVLVKHLDIVACTHADGDHAGGLTDLLDRHSITVQEFWLPGEWGESLPELLRNPQMVVNALLSELDSFSNADEDFQDERGDASEARVHSWIGEARRLLLEPKSNVCVPAESGEGNGRTGLAWLKSQASDECLDDEKRAVAAKAFENGRRRVRYRVSKGRVHALWASIWLDAIKTAERIRKIAIQAIRHNVSVRWFDFNMFVRTGQALGGDPELLIPLNAVELSEPRMPPLTLSYFMRLTPINEQSLVFQSPCHSDHWPHDLDVVFTGDSPLGTGPGYSNSFLSASTSRHWAIATAPHHGSESNSMAYKHLSNVSCVLLWLRSGGSAKQPGPTFKNLPRDVRACMHCPQKGYVRKLAVVLLSPSLGPFWRLTAHDCDC